MTIKDILVHLDASECSDLRLDAAVILARKHQARLRGIYTGAGYHISSDKDIRAEHDFLRKTLKAGVESDWITTDPGLMTTDIIAAVTYEAHFSDLVIAGQPVPEEKVQTPSNLPEWLIASSGRPVLIIPYAGRFTHVGERILVAWKPGAKSTRALNDALPLLQQARHVSVLSVNEAVHFGNKDREKICSHLLRHGISAKPGQVPPSNLGISNILLNLVDDEGIDLVVMGSYVSMRSGNPELGPVGKDLLKSMTVPVLMSH